MRDGKALKIMKKNTITADCVSVILRVFFVAPGGEVTYVYCNGDSWRSVAVGGSD